MIAGDAVDAALHGIDEQAALEGGSADTSREVLIGWERSLAGLVGDKFHGPEQANAANVSYTFFGPQRLEGLLKVVGRRALGRLEFPWLRPIFLASQILQDRASGGERNRVGVVGEAVQERAGAGGDRIDEFLAGDHGAEGSVSAGESLAVTRISGATLECSTAKLRPVRPMPVMTSSAIRSRPWRRQMPATDRRYPGGEEPQRWAWRR